MQDHALGPVVFGGGIAVSYAQGTPVFVSVQAGADIARRSGGAVVVRALPGAVRSTHFPTQGYLAHKKIFPA